MNLITRTYCIICRTPSLSETKFLFPFHVCGEIPSERFFQVVSFSCEETWKKNTTSVFPCYCSCKVKIMQILGSRNHPTHGWSPLSDGAVIQIYKSISSFNICIGLAICDALPRIVNTIILKRQPP